MKQIKSKKIIFLLVLAFIYIYFSKFVTTYSLINKKRVGVINLGNYQNVGTALVKYSVFKKLEEFGFNVTIIAPKIKQQVNIDFLKRTIKSKLLIIENFNELQENDFDYIFLSSDQTWAYRKYFFDIAFLKFAENWTIPKFIYGASFGRDKWFYTRYVEEIAKKLLKNFTGISFREKGLVKLVEEHLGIKGEFVLDPTLLINKEYYLQEISNYKNDFSPDEKFIFVYQLNEDKLLEKVMEESSKKFNYKIYKHQMKKNDYVESFIFGINNCQAVITDSFHGTIFSIRFNKPFISFMNVDVGKGRFDSIKEAFNMENRIIYPSNRNNVDINLLLQPPNVKEKLFNELQTFSINYLKKDLGLL